MSVTRNKNSRKSVRRTISRHEELRRRFGYSVGGLAAALGFSAAYVSMVEGGARKPSARYRAAVSRLLGVPGELIFDEEASES